MHRLLPIALCALMGCTLYDLIPPEADMSVSPQPNNTSTTNNPDDVCAPDDSDWMPCGGQDVCYEGVCRSGCLPRDASSCEEGEICAATFRGYTEGSQNYGPHLCMERQELSCEDLETERDLLVDPEIVCRQAHGPGSLTNPACIKDAEDGWTCRPACRDDGECDTEAGEECLLSEFGDATGCAIPAP